MWRRTRCSRRSCSAVIRITCGRGSHAGECSDKAGKSGDWSEVAELRARPRGDLGRYGFAGDAVYRGEAAIHHWYPAEGEHNRAKWPVHARKDSAACEQQDLTRSSAAWPARAAASGPGETPSRASLERR